MWLAIFFITPILEMYLLIEVGGYIGALPTIALVMITAVIGVALLRVQGLATLTRGLRRLDQGQVPAREVAEGLLLAVAGALLLTPGFVTDAVGFALLTGPIRARVAERLLSRVQIMGTGTGTGTGRGAGPGATRGTAGGQGQVLEGDYERVDEPRASDRD